MKLTRFLLVLMSVILVAVLAACTGPATPVNVATQPVETQSVVEDQPAATQTAEIPTTGDGLRPIEMLDVQVQIGQGSPALAEVVVAGAWPELCSQLAAIEQRVNGNNIQISLLASAAVPDCPPDHVGLTFGMALPLNMVEMPAGTYTVSVNGKETSFDWPGSGSGAASDAVEGEPALLSVEDVQVEVGVGSPIPVMVRVSGTYPGLCSQVSRVEQRIEGSNINISILAGPDSAGCPADVLGVPFRLTIPLNGVQMPLGAYTVTVNGVKTAFDWQGQPVAQEQPLVTEQPVVEDQPDGTPGAFNLVYTGLDGNLWVKEAQSDAPRQLTQDANNPGASDNTPAVQYSSPALSSDGQMLAYRKDVGLPQADGYHYTFSLWVTTLATGQSQQVVDGMTAGFAWKPRTRLLVYAKGVPEGYFSFTNRGQIESSLAQGIWGVDLDQPGIEPVELVRPERGYSLAAPVWAPDGRFLSFDEVHLYEGKGMFAYYDFEAQEYVAWDESIGQYAWNLDGTAIYYDRMTYTATGEERIYMRPRLAGLQQQILPDLASPAYAFNPRVSPQGDRIAYLVSKLGPDSQQFTLVVQSIAGGEPQELGTFEGNWSVSWTPDGNGLVFSSGPYEAQQIILVNVSDAAQIGLAQGREPVLPAP